MLETLRGLLETAKATTYELLALLLPGAIILAALERTCGILIPFDTIGTITTAYIFGMVLQAIADFVLKRKRIAKWIQSEKPTWKPSADYALRLIQKKLEAAPAEATLDVCLTQVGARRSIYDKFIALRDTARGLAFATVVTAALVIVDEWDAITSGSRPYAVAKVAAAILFAIVMFLAFIQRYARFYPLANQAVYGQFLATQFDARTNPPEKE